MEHQGNREAPGPGAGRIKDNVVGTMTTIWRSGNCDEPEGGRAEEHRRTDGRNQDGTHARQPDQSSTTASACKLKIILMEAFNEI